MTTQIDITWPGYRSETIWRREPPTEPGLFWHCDERDQVALLHLVYPADCSGDVVTYSKELKAKLTKAYHKLMVLSPVLKLGFFAIPKGGWWTPCIEPKPPLSDRDVEKRLVPIDGQMELFGGAEP